MKPIDLRERPELANDSKAGLIYTQIHAILNELDRRELPNKVVESLNLDIDELNKSLLTGKELRKLVNEKQSKILKLMEQELKLVPKNHFRNIWLALGMAAFGVPIGVAFGLSIGNMGMLAIGIPIGMVIGLAVGTKLDKKAAEEGRQLDVELTQ